MKTLNILTCLLVASLTSTAKHLNDAKGKQLIARSDCRACHAEKTKLVGPSYLDIASKYPSTTKNISILAGRIISGSKGVWGNIPMTAHPKLSRSDAEEMVKYILTVRK